MINNFAALFNCRPVGRTSDLTKVSTYKQKQQQQQKKKNFQ